MSEKEKWLSLLSVLQIWDPVHFWPLDPGYVKSQDPGWTTRIIFPKVWIPFFMVKILKFCDADTGSGMEKIQIRDGKNSDPGSEKNILDPQHFLL